MTQTLVIFAALVAGAYVVDAQLIAGQPDNKPAGNYTDGSLPGPIPIADATKKDQSLPEGPSQSGKSENEAEGDRYSWFHDLGSGAIYPEEALVENGTRVIVVKSKSRLLAAQNITRSTSAYYLPDTNSLVAIVLWKSGPCIIRNTTLTYDEAVALIIERNGTTVQTTEKVAIDANVAPLSSEEANTFLSVNPGLQRTCSSRPIVVTYDLGENPVPYSNSTEEILTLALEADISIIVPDLALPDASNTGDFVKDSSQGSVDQGSRWGVWRDTVIDQAPIQTEIKA